MSAYFTAYTLEPLESAWIMLFDTDVNDTLIFNSTPSYISKTDFKGDFYFTNLKEKDYKMFSITGGDFIYDKEEKIAFLDSVVNAKKDSIISLFAFKPIDIMEKENVDTVLLETEPILLDSINQKKDNPSGSLQILTISPPCIFQLLQNDDIKIEAAFNNSPYLFNKINPGQYKLKYIIDANQDSVWNTGSWENKIQPEKVLNYLSEIMIRSNWDLEIDWIILE